MKFSVQLAESDGDIFACAPVMLQLRPNLSTGLFVEIVRDMMSEGYQLAFIRSEGSALAAAGFRVAKSLWMGKHLYVDDLVSDEKSRSLGLGQALMNWLVDYAKTKDCSHVHLDSGVQRHRAHRFYLNQGLDIVCYHFSKKL